MSILVECGALAVGLDVTFTYGESQEPRVGVVEKIHPNGTVTLRDEAREGNYRSFKAAKITNLRIRGR